MTDKPNNYIANKKLSSLESLSLEEIVNLSNKVGLEFVIAKKEADRYDLLKSSQRSRLMEKHDDGKKSEAKIKRLAESDPEYIEFLEKYIEAKFRSEQLRIRYESYKNLFEARRSSLSYQKAEMNLL
jgi:hypothetical protein